MVMCNDVGVFKFENGYEYVGHTGFQDFVSIDACLIEEEDLNKEIALSMQKLEAGEEFAFYNLSLSSSAKEVLDLLEITKSENVILKSTSFNVNLKEEIGQALGSMNGVSATTCQINYLSHLFARFISVILGQIGSKDFEMHIRIKDAYNDTYHCIYWHLDKSCAEILGEESSVQEKRFIIPLKGSSTSYQKIRTDTRDQFLELAEEYIYYYGHSSGGCVDGNAISRLLNSSRIYKPEIGFGSVHVASRNGAMHAEPNESADRLILLITPIE